MENQDPNKELKEMIAYLAQSDDPDTLEGYYQTFKAIERNKLKWILDRLDNLQAKNHKLEIELFELKFLPWYKRLFYPLLSKK